MQKIEPKYVIREMTILASMRHPRIITMYGLCIDDIEGAFIVTELAQCSLRALLNRSNLSKKLKVR